MVLIEPHIITSKKNCNVHITVTHKSSQFVGSSYVSIPFCIPIITSIAYFALFWLKDSSDSIYTCAFVCTSEETQQLSLLNNDLFPWINRLYTDSINKQFCCFLHAYEESLCMQIALPPSLIYFHLPAKQKHALLKTMFFFFSFALLLSFVPASSESLFQLSVYFISALFGFILFFFPSLLTQRTISQLC